MNISRDNKIEDIFSSCRSILRPEDWNYIIKLSGEDSDPEVFLNQISHRIDGINLPDFLHDLARLELAIHKVDSSEKRIPLNVNQIEVNPSIQFVQLSWKNLSGLLNQDEGGAKDSPERGDEQIIVWKDQATHETKIQAASSEDLLVIKMIFEKIEPETAAVVGDVPVRTVDAVIDRGIQRGILLAPDSLICRDPSIFDVEKHIDDRFLSASVFTLQWHITQACDLHCKHCYDRTDISTLPLEKMVRILDNLRHFCRSRFVKGHVSFSGGNPLLYPQFLKLYRAASERGFSLAILGNAAPRKYIEELIAIQKPSHFQVSLEGLREHNDFVRGDGYFDRVITFLDMLRELDVYSMVMLTLTKDNMDQVIPLAETLRSHADYFTFNRLSLVGEGANLQLPSRRDFIAFLEDYVDASKSNPIMGLKDNLINILHREKGIEPFGGCAGHGCGAAFNFITVLPDGEAHACRKFPSLIGNVDEQGIAGVYDSDMAHRYRAGCSACRACAIRPVCGGCLAVAYSHGCNVFEERDPYCFIDHYRVRRG